MKLFNSTGRRRGITLTKLLNKLWRPAPKGKYPKMEAGYYPSIHSLTRKLVRKRVRNQVKARRDKYISAVRAQIRYLRAKNFREVGLTEIRPHQMKVKL